MKYNETLFGEKQDVYNDSNSTQLYCSVASQNSTLSAGLKTGAYQINSNINDSVFYWLVNSQSPYTRLSLINLISRGGVNTINKVDTDAKDKHLPLVLTWQNFKINAEHNVDTTGTLPNSAKNTIPNGRFTQSMFKTQGDVDNPLLYNTNGLSESTKNNNFNKAPFVVDFDYNNIIATIQVGAGASSNVQDLANYNNTVDNYISTISIAFYIGVIDDNNLSRVNSYMQQRYINGVYCGGSGNNGMTVVSDYRYKTPDVLRNAPFYYGIDEFNFFQAITTSIFTTALFSGVLASGTNIYNVSYYMDDEHWELNDNNNGYRLKKHGNGVYNDDDFNYIRKCVAYLGFWFTDGGYYTDNEHSYNIYRHNTKLGINANEYADSYMIPDHVYQSEIKDGITTGKFTELRIAKDNDQSKWGKEWRDKNGYNGRTQGGDEQQDTGILKTTIRNSMIPTNTRDYAMTGTQLKQLITWCNSGFQVTDSAQFLEDFKGLNPADCVISAMYFPFDVGAMATAAVHVGNLDTGITAQYANMGANFGGGSEFSYSPLTINRKFGDFRDYAPYTTIDMYVPFCGSVSLDPADVYGYDLTVTIIPDLMTGSCTGCIYRGEYLLQTIDGKIGMPITLSLGQVGDYQNAVTQAQFNLKNANRQMFNSWLGAVASVGAIATGAGAIVGIAGLTGSAMGMLQAQDNIKKAEYDLAHIARNFNTVGSVSDVNTVMVLPEYVHMIIKRPCNLEGANIKQYAHTVGHACNKQGYVSDFSGYTLASDIDLTGISATAEELEQIRKYFATGVYL